MVTFSSTTTNAIFAPDTKEPFTGMSYEYFVTVHGWASIKYLPLKNGRRDGVEVLMKDDGTIHRKTHWKQNQFHGPNDWYYLNGNPQEKAVYDMTPSNPAGPTPR